MAYALLAQVEAQSTGGSGNGFTTGGIDTTGADLIVVVVAGYNFFNTPTITDSKSNSYSALTPQSVSNEFSNIYYSQGGTFGSGHTFTVNGNATYCSISVSAWSGSTSSPFDQENGNTQAAGTTVATGAITPSENNCLVIAAINNTVAGATNSIDGGFAEIDEMTTVADNAYGVGAAYLVQTTAASANPTWTSSASGKLLAKIASFKAGAGGGGGGGKVRRRQRMLMGVG